MTRYCDRWNAMLGAEIGPRNEKVARKRFEEGKKISEGQHPADLHVQGGR